MTTDELRAKFEAFHGVTWDEIQTMSVGDGSRMHLEHAYERALDVYRAGYEAAWRQAWSAIDADLVVAASKKFGDSLGVLKNAERLDWLSSHYRWIDADTPTIAFDLDLIATDHPDALREAIDAAMAKEPTHD